MADLPKWHQFMLPLLEVLQEQGELSRNDAIDEVVQKVGLTDEQMAVSQESNGKSIARDRIGWASSYLRTAGALIGPKRGYFALGPNAPALLALGRPIKRADLTGFAEWQEHQAAKQAKSQSTSDSTSDINTEDSTPEDLIEAGVKQIKEQLVTDLLDQMKDMDPHDFEGLDQIYMQAKRYSENSVSSEKVQAFVGAMTSGGCGKGVFVTTSKFTADAMRFAESIRDPRLVLVDGDKLANLMIQHGVGIQTKEVIKISKIDLDFFSGGGD